MSETELRGTTGASGTTREEAENGPNMNEYWDQYCYVNCPKDFVSLEVCLACDRLLELQRIPGRGFFGESASPIRRYIGMPMATTRFCEEDEHPTHCECSKALMPGEYEEIDGIRYYGGDDPHGNECDCRVCNPRTFGDLDRELDNDKRDHQCDCEAHWKVDTMSRCVCTKCGGEL